MKVAWEKPSVLVVATPIGNLEDLTPRAREALATADLIAAEDTRVTRKLLSHLGLQGRRLVAYHDHGETERAGQLVDEIREKSWILALVSDAGTPAISDPGYRLVAAAHAAGIPVHPVAGPSSLTALASASGLPTDRLLFIGFLPDSPRELAEEIESWPASRATVVFFEATRRLARTFEAIRARHPEAQVAVGRELTKLHEQVARLPVAEAGTWLSAQGPLKGEVTVMIAMPRSAVVEALDPESVRAAAVKAFKEGASLKDLLIRYREAGLSRAELYDLLLAAKDAAARSK